MNLPNALTMFRMLLVPAFAWAYYRMTPAVALVLYLAASFTDFLDGYLARKLNQITNFGKLFDPLADKLMQVMMLYCLYSTGHVPGWVLAVMIVKEALMLAGSAYMLKKKVVVYSNIWGKAATCAFIAALVLIYPWHEIDALRTAGNVILYAALALSVLSMALYGLGALRTLREKSGASSTQEPDC